MRMHAIDYDAHNVLADEKVRQGMSTFWIFLEDLFDRLWDCPEEGSSDPGLGSIISIVACELE